MPVLDLAELDHYVEQNRPDVAVLTVPQSVAQSTADRLVSLGVRGFWNFTNVELSSEMANVRFEDVHFADSLLTLSYRITDRCRSAPIKGGHMKKMLTAAALLLALALCLTAALAAGGGAGDPLISLSYLQSIFAPSAEPRRQQKLDQADASTRSAVDQQISRDEGGCPGRLGLNTALLLRKPPSISGDILSGTTGLTVLPLAGRHPAHGAGRAGGRRHRPARKCPPGRSLPSTTATSWQNPPWLGLPPSPPPLFSPTRAPTPSLPRDQLPTTSPSPGPSGSWICSGAPVPVSGRALISICRLPGQRGWSCSSAFWGRRTTPWPATTPTPTRMCPRGLDRYVAWA